MGLFNRKKIRELETQCSDLELELAKLQSRYDVLELENNRLSTIARDAEKARDELLSKMTVYEELKKAADSSGFVFSEKSQKEKRKQARLKRTGGLAFVRAFESSVLLTDLFDDHGELMSASEHSTISVASSVVGGAVGILGDVVGNVESDVAKNTSESNVADECAAQVKDKSSGYREADVSEARRNDEATGVSDSSSPRSDAVTTSSKWSSHDSYDSDDSTSGSTSSDSFD